MRQEFERYHLARYRIVVAGLQILGAAGQLAGVWYSPIGVAATAGLAMMMLFAVGVRVKIGDSILQTIPASLYLVANVYLLAVFLRS